jgi:hypothetical protein
VAKVGTFKAGGTISQQSAIHPWLAADAHGNKRTNKFKQDLLIKTLHLMAVFGLNLKMIHTLVL